ncbi:MAG: alpha-1,4-glucan--maltose-1-phosphate maltosyltransferase [Proteobacteria bacterium]|nr:alpha-1,4-glucan--maltose-1-phosphate maltosyltransferase [Pseudomonadota bacterium]
MERQPEISGATCAAGTALYYMPGALAGQIAAWPAHLERARRLGFRQVCTAPLARPGQRGDLFLIADYDKPDPRLGGFDTTEAAMEAAATMARKAGLDLYVDVVLDRIAIDATDRTGYEPPRGAGALDPRRPGIDIDAALAQFDRSDLLDRWSTRLCAWKKRGVAGFRLLGLERTPAEFVRQLVIAVGRHCLAWTPGVEWPRLEALAGLGLDGVFASTPWWDGRAPWYVEEHELLRRIAPIIAPVEAPFGARLAQRAQGSERRTLYEQALTLAGATGDGLLMPMGFEFMADQPLDARFPTALPRMDGPSPLAGAIASALAMVGGGRMRSLTGPGNKVTALEMSASGRLVLINTDLANERPPPIAIEPAVGLLKPGETRIVSWPALRPVATGALPKSAVLDATMAPRTVVENITPRVDGGPFAAKRIAGQTITVEADAYADGHDVLAVELLWKAADESQWQRTPMASLGNARWQARFTPFRVGRYQYTVEAWIDEYATLCRAIRLKRDAGVDIAVELEEVRLALEAAIARKSCTRSGLSEVLATLNKGDVDASVQALISPETRNVVSTSGERHFLTRHAPLDLEVEREAAGFAAWYELFPRSLTGDRKRHGTFEDVIAHLPRVRDMGFDVLYFPPIHPIGTTARKGKNNTLTAAPEDLGSPYAIGSAEGGHDALHPALGTFADFRRLIDAAREHGLEIAIDFAIQCSPDHPWLKQHPDWFRHRPDGTIKYAENPPKKYEDIVNVDFYAPGAMPSLWEALRDIVLFWIGHGVKIFRVDNPHTKPLPFWEWMIADVRGRHADAIFLSEAFTHPKMMYRLAKVGFSQSYTYFTWRNSKQELTEYLTELTTTAPADFFRPNFFVNTPDINPVFLQSSGRAGFVIRAVLAATLSGLWGVYSGFELCEGAPLPGREEYLDSEKYEIRVRDFNAPGNIVHEITALNRIRRAHPALHSHLGVRFYNSSNDQVMAYGKALPGHEDMIFTVVSLDPHNVQETSFEIPLWEWKLPDSASLAVEDLMTGNRFTLHGKRQWLRLDPGQSPFVLWRLFPESSA